MCRVCAAELTGRAGISRRAFHGALLASAGLWASRPASAAQRLMEPVIRLDVPTGAPRTVALTLDVCSGATDLRVLDTLIRLDVAATIFITGLWLRDNAAAMARLRARPELFSLQNHGARHLPAVLGNTRIYGLPVAGTLEAIRAEVDQGADAVAAAGAARPSWYRGAGGLYSPAAQAPIEESGFKIAGWSLNADAGASLPAEIVGRRIAEARSGDVIVAHMNQPRRASGAGVAEGIQALHGAGARFVTLDALPMTKFSG